MCGGARRERVSSLESPAIRVRRYPGGAGRAAPAQSPAAADGRGAPGEGGRPLSPALPLRQPGVHAERPQRLCFWQGRWHLFYQARLPEDPRQHWGHAVSPDLIRWWDLPYAIGPGPEERCYPGRRDSTGVSLISRGPASEVQSLDCWQMRSIYESGQLPY